MSRDLLQCQTPLNYVDGHVSLEVSFNGRDYQACPMNFYFYSEAVVSAISPYAGPSAGGTLVTIFGRNFLRVHGLRCQFGDHLSSPASYVERSIIQCITPRFSREGLHDIIVSSPDQGYGIGGMGYGFFAYDDLEIMSILPSKGFFSGGAKVEIVVNTTSPLPELGGYKCKFGDQVVAATRQNNNTISCISPSTAIQSGSEHSASVFISLNGLQFSLSSSVAKFIYQPDYFINELFPRSGSLSGMTVFNIFGEHLMGIAGEQPECSFRSSNDDSYVLIMPAYVTSANNLSCEVPQWDPDSGGKHATVSVGSNGMIRPDSGRLQVTFHSDAIIKSMEPSSGFLFSGAKIKLGGSDFENTPDMTCALIVSPDHNCSARPSIISLQFMFLSSESLVCYIDEKALEVIKREKTSNIVSIRVSNNGIDWYGCGQHFMLHSEPKIENIRPVDGPASGFTPIHVIGSGFFESDLSCDFSGISVSAKWISSTEIVCVSPPQVRLNGTAVIQLIVSIESFEIGYADFAYFPTPYLISVYPPSGPVRGGTVAQLHGRNFNDTKSMSCLFGGVKEVPAVFMRPTLIECVVPNMADVLSVEEMLTMPQSRGVSVGFALNSFLAPKKLVFFYQNLVPVVDLRPAVGRVGTTIAIYLGSLYFDVQEQIFCRFGTDGPVVRSSKVIANSRILVTVPDFSREAKASAEISLSRNGIDFSPTGLNFTVHSDILIKSVSPIYGPAGGGAMVTISGSGFFDTGDFNCRFGIELVRPQIVTANRVECRSPPVITDHSAPLPLEISVSVNMVR